MTIAVRLLGKAKISLRHIQQLRPNETMAFRAGVNRELGRLRPIEFRSAHDACTYSKLLNYLFPGSFRPHAYTQRSLNSFIQAVHLSQTVAFSVLGLDCRRDHERKKKRDCNWHEILGQWGSIRIAPIASEAALRIVKPKYGEERAFDLLLSRAMLRCLWRARQIGRRLFPKNAERWIFPGPVGHVRGDSLTRDGVLANHALRRTYATIGRAAGVPKDSIRRLLDHSGGDVTDHYIRESGLGRLHAIEQETISAAIVNAVGSSPGLI
jgi:integrase